MLNHRDHTLLAAIAAKHGNNEFTCGNIDCLALLKLINHGAVTETIPGSYDSNYRTALLRVAITTGD